MYQAQKSVNIKTNETIITENKKINSLSHNKKSDLLQNLWMTTDGHRLQRY